MLSVKQKKVLFRFVVFAVPLLSAANYGPNGLFSKEGLGALGLAILGAGEKYWSLNQQDVEDSLA